MDCIGYQMISTDKLDDHAMSNSHNNSQLTVVSCNQTAFFSLMIGWEKRVWYNAGTFSGWLLIGVDKDFLEVTNHESGVHLQCLK